MYWCKIISKIYWYMRKAGILSNVPLCCHLIKQKEKNRFCLCIPGVSLKKCIRNQDDFHIIRKRELSGWERVEGHFKVLFLSFCILNFWTVCMLCLFYKYFSFLLSAFQRFLVSHKTNLELSKLPIQRVGSNIQIFLVLKYSPHILNLLTTNLSFYVECRITEEKKNKVTSLSCLWMGSNKLPRWEL